MSIKKYTEHLHEINSIDEYLDAASNVLFNLAKEIRVGIGMSQRNLDSNQDGDWKCNICEDTGWYGDNGPGQSGNSEYVECECQTQQHNE